VSAGLAVQAVPATPGLKHYIYVVVDVTDPARSPLHCALSRKAAREWLEWQQDADHMRVRRASLMIYDS
jgi:hypothetical protein